MRKISRSLIGKKMLWRGPHSPARWILALAVSAGCCFLSSMSIGVVAEPSAILVSHASSVDELKRMSSGEMSRLRYIDVDTFHAGGDRGGGRFRYLMGGQCTIYEADGSYIIAPADKNNQTSDGCLQRQISDGTFHSEDWGVKSGDTSLETKRFNNKAMNDMFQSAIRNNKDVYIDCGNISIDGSIIIEFDKNKNPITQILNIRGCGSVSAFAVEGGGGTRIVSDDAPVFHFVKSERFRHYSRRVQLSNIGIVGNIENHYGKNPALLFDVLSQGGFIHDIDIYQHGRGPGIVCSDCYLNRFEDITILGSTAMNSPPVNRYGVGFLLNVNGHSGGLTAVNRVTSRGFNWGFQFGHLEEQQGGPLSFRCQQCETSMNSNGWLIGKNAVSTVIDNSYNDGGLDGTIVYDAGVGTVVRNLNSWGGFRVGIDSSHGGASGSIYEGNTFRLSGEGAVGMIISADVAKKFAVNNIITFSDGDNQIGIRIVGKGKIIEGLNSNGFYPSRPICINCATIKSE